MDDKPPRNLKAMLSEAKDTSELMVDLAYAALFFNDEHVAAEVQELEERLSGLVHEMREICILAARSPHDAEEMSSVLHVVSAIERMANAAEDISRIVTRRLGIPVDYGEHRPLACQPQCGGATDATTAAGDQDNATLEPHGALHAASASRTRPSAGGRQCP